MYLYRDINQKFTTSGKEVVGYITYKSKNVKRKVDESMIWYDAENKEPITKRDSIRSEDLSDAVIHLKDGTEIKLSENSMIVIDMSIDSLLINFESGNFSVNRENVKSPTMNLQIQSGETTLTVNKDSDVNLKKENSDSNLDVSVEKGNAELKTGDTVREIKKDEKISIKEGNTVIEAKTVIKTESPKTNRILEPREEKEYKPPAFKSPNLIYAE